MRYTYENTAAIGEPKDVYLDGVKIDDACEADTVDGYVIRGKRNAEGNLYLDENDEVATERLTGAVVVVPKAD